MTMEKAKNIVLFKLEMVIEMSKANLLHNTTSSAKHRTFTLTM